MLKISVEITANAEAPYYTALEQSVISALQAGDSWPTEVPPKAAAAPEKVAAAPKAEPKAAPKAEPKAAPVAKKAEPKPEEPVAEEPVAEEDEPTLQEELIEAEPVAEVSIDAAVAAATKLVSEGKSAEVKAALATAGAKRVSGLSGKAIGVFLEALEG